MCGEGGNLCQPLGVADVSLPGGCAHSHFTHVHYIEVVHLHLTSQLKYVRLFPDNMAGGKINEAGGGHLEWEKYSHWQP